MSNIQNRFAIAPRVAWLSHIRAGAMRAIAQVARRTRLRVLLRCQTMIHPKPTTRYKQLLKRGLSG